MNRTLNRVILKVVSGAYEPDTGLTVELYTDEASPILIGAAAETPIGSGQYSITFASLLKWGAWYVGGSKKSEWGSSWLGDEDPIPTANTIVGISSSAAEREQKAIVGTANRITVTHTAGQIQLSAPQDLHTSASPTFLSLWLDNPTPSSLTEVAKLGHFADNAAIPQWRLKTIDGATLVVYTDRWSGNIYFRRSGSTGDRDLARIFGDEGNPSQLLLYDSSGVAQIAIRGSGVSEFVGSTISIGSSTAASGSLRLPNNTAVAWRNAGGSADISITLDAANIFALSNGAMRSNAFTSGVLGLGWRIDDNSSVTSQTYMEIDNLRVRGTMAVAVFKKDIIRVSNGILYISDSSTTTAAVTIGGAATTILIAEDVFQVEDVLLLQDFDMSGGGLTVRTTYGWVQGASAGQISFYWLSGPTGYSLKAGATIVRVGNGDPATYPGRAGGILLAGSDGTTHSPYLDVYDDRTSEAATPPKVRLGKLTGVASLSGWGFYLSAGSAGGGEAALWADAANARLELKLAGTTRFKFDSATSAAQIAGWDFTATKLSKGSVALDSSVEKIIAGNSGSDSSGTGIRVVLGKYDGTNWGIRAWDGTTPYFVLSSSAAANQIAGWSFSASAISKTISVGDLQKSIYLTVGPNLDAKVFDTGAIYNGVEAYVGASPFDDYFGFGLYVVDINGDPSSELMLVAKDTSDPSGAQVARIAGWSFDSAKLFGLGTKYTILQKSGDSFIAGASDSAGTGATLKINEEGSIKLGDMAGRRIQINVGGDQTLKIYDDNNAVTGAIWGQYNSGTARHYLQIEGSGVSNGRVVFSKAIEYVFGDQIVIGNSDIFTTIATLANGSLSIGASQVVGARQTGWGAPTGTATRTTFATTVTLPQLAERVKALIDDLTTHGLIGA